MKQRTLCKKNRGFSLVEVIVAIAVLAVLTIPIIRSFATSAQANKKARRIQNATDVAQSVSEYFGKASIDDIKALSAGTVSTDNPDDMIFTSLNDWRTTDSSGIFHGASGEKFSVDVEMKSRTSPVPVGASGVANYTLSELKDLFGDNSVSCMEQISKMDDDARNHFGAGAQKKSVFNIYIEKQADGKFKYKYELTVSYNGDAAYTKTMTIDYGVIEPDDTFPSMYVVYDIFDKAGKTDQIIVNYNSTCTLTDNCPSMKFCLIQQKYSTPTGEVRLNDTNFHLVNNSTIVDDRLPIVCINNFTSDGIITTDGSRIVRVYDINVTVKLNGKEMANVSTVREEIE